MACDFTFSRKKTGCLDALITNRISNLFTAHLCFPNFPDFALNLECEAPIKLLRIGLVQWLLGQGSVEVQYWDHCTHKEFLSRLTISILLVRLVSFFIFPSGGNLCRHKSGTRWGFYKLKEICSREKTRSQLYGFRNSRVKISPKKSNKPRIKYRPKHSIFPIRKSLRALDRDLFPIYLESSVWHSNNVVCGQAKWQSRREKDATRDGASPRSDLMMTRIVRPGRVCLP